MEPTSPVSATTLEEDDSLSDVSPATAQHMESPMENLSVPAAVAVGASARGVPGRRTKHKVPDRGVLHDITSAVFATTRFAVLNPAAVVAAPLASLTLDQLKSLLPDHVASRVCVAGVDLAAKLSGVVADSDEGVAARRAVVKLATATLDCAATPEGQRVFVAGAEAALRGAAPRGGDRDKKALVALRAATRAALRVAASNEADVAVKRGFHALDAAMALAQSEPVHRAVREAVDDVVDALAERHAERTQTRNAQKRAMHRGDAFETLSECSSSDSDDSDDGCSEAYDDGCGPRASGGAAAARAPKVSFLWRHRAALVAAGAAALWCALAVVGLHSLLRPAARADAGLAGVEALAALQAKMALLEAALAHKLQRRADEL